MTIALEITPKRPHPDLTSQTWHDATWDDYVALRDDESIEFKKLSFHKTENTTGWLWVDMSHEGIDHSRFSDLMTMIFYIWKLLHPTERLDSMGRCLIECPDSHGCSPDLVLYKGGNRPIWKTGEPRRIDLTRHRLPDLVGEIADTSLRQDLAEQKKLYESLGISEYWVINVRASKILAFQLDETGTYQSCLESGILAGLPIALLEQTIARLATQDNTDAADWFREQLTDHLEPLR
jgi:Uma2 family endonuclease